MNKEVKEKWIAALRNGEYIQGKGALRTPDNKFCCLGVLEDLHAKEQGKAWEKGEDCYIIRSEIGIASAYLREETRTWAGLDSVNPMAGNQALAFLNDDGTTFSEIADIIEKEL